MKYRVKETDVFRTTCPLCSGTTLRYLSVVNGYPACRCSDCEFVFLNPQPAQDMKEMSDGKQVIPQSIVLDYLKRISTKPRNIGLISQLNDKDEMEAIKSQGIDAEYINIFNEEIEAGSYECVLIRGALLNLVNDPIEILQKIYQLLSHNGQFGIVLNSEQKRYDANSTMKNWEQDQICYLDHQVVQNVLAKVGFAEVTTISNNGYLIYSAVKVAVRERKLLSVIVPVYNEKATFSAMMTQLIDLQLENVDKEIIVIESNSTDGTKEEVYAFEKQGLIRVIWEDRPRGKGHAVRHGLQSAVGDFVLIQDGDLEYDLNDYEQLIDPLAKYQTAFVLGSRHTGSWKMRKFDDQALHAVIMNFGQVFFTGLLNLFCGSRLKDPFTMYKVFRRDCTYGLTFKANRFDFDWEIVIKFLRKGYVPLEVPINYKSRSFKEGKKVSMIKDPILWIWALIRFRFGSLYETHSK